MSLLSIIVPVFNEEATVRAVIARLCEIPLPAPREIVVVNDGSTDGTRAVLDALDRQSGVRVIHAPVSGGKGSAVRRGLREARGAIVAIRDGDLALDPTPPRGSALNSHSHRAINQAIRGNLSLAVSRGLIQWGKLWCRATCRGTYGVA